jgi:hypothetical protein
MTGGARLSAVVSNGARSGSHWAGNRAGLRSGRATGDGIQGARSDFHCWAAQQHREGKRGRERSFHNF